MKPRLVIGLGNPLMGDDGVGCRVAERLAADPRLPPGVEVISGGTDLLRCAGQIEGRTSVLVVDAVQTGAEPGSVQEIDPQIPDRQDHAHHLSAAQALTLLRMLTPAPVRLLGIAVRSAACEPDLSPALAARVPSILDRLLEELK